jgi:protein-export membrane protein SecD
MLNTIAQTLVAFTRRAVLLLPPLWALVLSGPGAEAQSAPWPAAAELVFEVGPGGAPDAVQSVVQARLEELRPRRTEVILDDAGRIVVRLRSGGDRDLAVGVASQTGRLQIALVASDDPIDIQAALAESGGPPEGQVLAPTGQEYEPYLLLYLERPGVDAAALSGRHFSQAAAGFHPANGSPIVNFRLDAAGARALSQLTTTHAGERIAIVLDGVVLSAPTVAEPITGGAAYIDGGFTTDSAQALAAIINAGALPAPLTLVEEVTEP